MKMRITIDKCINMLIAKEKCIMHKTSGIDTDCNSNNCDDCSLCYEQGTMGEQREALRFAVDTMYKYQKIQKIINIYDSTDISYKDTLQDIREVIEDGSENNHHASNT